MGNVQRPRHRRRTPLVGVALVLASCVLPNDFRKIGERSADGGAGNGGPEPAGRGGTSGAAASDLAGAARGAGVAGGAGAAAGSGGAAGTRCETDETCDDGEPCNGLERCDRGTERCVAGDARDAGDACSTEAVPDGRCAVGDAALQCVPRGCGNLLLEAGEECDDGRNSDPTDGCRDDCQYSCHTADDCRDAEGDCDGIDRCNSETHRCEEGEPLDCAATDPCHTARCEPAIGCAQSLIDDDHDGEAPVTLGACGTDCDDTRGEIGAGAQERPGDEVDQDCDGQELCYVDGDGDGVRGTAVVVSSDLDCRDAGEALSSLPDGDCDDERRAIFPGATEIVGDEVDQDCDGGELCFADADGDGIRTATPIASEDADCSDPGEALPAAPDGDCDDQSACQRPAAVEYCNGLDDDCDGTVDEACAELLSAGAYHDCALGPSGTVECWGNGESGQTAPPPGPWSTLGEGWNHGCGVRQDSVVECWGNDVDGRATPPSGLFAKVTSGWNHTCGLRHYGTIDCWGRNGEGQATAPPGLFVDVSAGGYHTCGLRTDGTVECWGYDGDGRTDAPPDRFLSVAAGGYHTCGVRADHTIACWGANESNQLDVPEGTFLTVTAGELHSCGVRTDGTVACWGDDSSGQSSPPPGAFAAVSAGSGHSCGLGLDGAIECWGDDSVGQSSPPPGVFARDGICGTWIDPNRLGPFVIRALVLYADCTPSCTDADFPLDWGVVRTFSFTIPPGNAIVDVIVGSAWGTTSSVDGSAPAEISLDGVLVAACNSGERCWTTDDPLSGWSFSFAEQQVPDFAALFADGLAELSIVQTGPSLVAIQDFALTVVTAPMTAAAE